MRITTKEVRKVTRILDEIIEGYKERTVEKGRDWRTYELQLAERIRTSMSELEPLIEEAISSIKIVRASTRGRKPDLTLKQKTSLLLLKHLFGKSNREMSLMLVVFTLLSGIDASYKSVERLYSDPEVFMVLHNMHVLMLKKKGVKDPDCSGDGTGYTLTITRHYASEAQKLKDKAKENTTNLKQNHKKKRFAYAFMFMDLHSRMYTGFGTSFKSEKDAFLQSVAMAHATGMRSIRLDRYYSAQAYAKLLQERFPDITLYFVPKTNSTVKGPLIWKRMLYQFVNNTDDYLSHYFERNQSESGIGEDKNRCGWTIQQRREDRIDTAAFCTFVWHNLFWLKDQ